MTTPAGGENQPRIDPILTLSQKVSDTLSLGASMNLGKITSRQRSRQRTSSGRWTIPVCKRSGTAFR